ncbi:MAG: carboxypeptidase-like regulatory domain-containing protein [Acidobacteriota bacterium]|nr:carboxypeptidase-like regulatory domain-containing protein [Acidobacteriota bacterium]
MIGRTLSIALLSALECFAQEQTATLTGTVTDPFGLLIPNARVLLDSQEPKGLRFFVETDDLGQFRLADIPPATYRLEVGRPGFRMWQESGIRLLAGQQMSLATVFLIVGGGCGEPTVDVIHRLAPGDASSTLRGSVFDGNGSPIIGASVTLNGAGCMTKTTDAGHFVFSNLTPGNYTLSVSMKGFYPEALPHYAVLNDQEWTYFPIHLKRCPFGGCGLKPRPEQIAHCE